MLLPNSGRPQVPLCTQTRPAEQGATLFRGQIMQHVSALSFSYIMYIGGILFQGQILQHVSAPSFSYFPRAL